MTVRSRQPDQHAQATLILPDLEEGSVEHFAHFIMDYFIDVALFCRENPGQAIAVRDCGPCTKWFDLLRPLAPLETWSKDAIAAKADGFGATRTAIAAYSAEAGWDGPRLRTFREMMHSLIGERDPARRGLVVERKHEHPFYLSDQAEIQGSGPQRRKIANQTLLNRVIGTLRRAHCLDFTYLSAEQSVSLAANARFMVAQRGAAMMNFVFMEKGSTLVEILPQAMASKRNVDLYQSACEALDLNYRRIRQKDLHGNVSVARVLVATF